MKKLIPEDGKLFCNRLLTPKILEIMESKEPLIYAFKTASGNNYVFDVATNHTYYVDEVDIPVIKNFKKMSLDELKSFLFPRFTEAEVVKSYKKVSLWINKENAFFPEFSLKHTPAIPSEEEYFQEIANIQQFCLELTQECNLRCKYCVYGETYSSYRAHSNKSMPWEIAKRSIDYFLKLLKSEYRTTTLDKTGFSFYGGEPLIKFKMLKKCVEYIHKKHDHKEVGFNFTTNATLLDENMIRFLIKNNFSVLISLDGPASEHDKNRVFRNGKPTFDVVWKNVELFKSIDADFTKRKVGFNAVLNPHLNIDKVCSFFRTGSYRSVRMSDVSPVNTTYYDDLSTDLINNYYKEIEELYQEYFNRKVFNGNQHHEPLDELFGKSFKTLFKRYATTNALWGPGLCVPGKNKIYVSADGFFHACERVNHHFPVGDCWNGLNYQKLIKLFTKFNEQVRLNCKTCLVAYNCPVCYANTCSGTDFTVSDICFVATESFKKNLINYYSTLEDEPLAFSYN